MKAKLGPISIEVRDLPDEETCQRKIRYGNRSTADRALQNMTTEGRARKPLEVYACHFCDGWHLGRRRSRTRRVVATVLELIERVRS